MHYLSVNSQCIVTTKVSPRLLTVTIFKKPSVIGHSWPKDMRPLNTISSLSLPCNPHAVWFKPLLKFCLFKYVIPQRFRFPLTGKLFFCSPITCVDKMWFSFLGWYYICLEGMTAVIDSGYTQSCEIVWYYTWKKYDTGVKSSKVTTGTCIF